VFESFVDESLRGVLERAVERPITDDSRIVIFSDLHIGNGRRLDDFRKNAELFMDVLESYWNDGFTLVLNGDIEELQRYSHREIERSWPHLFEAFGRFQESDRLMKTVGNHDLKLLKLPKRGINSGLLHSVRLVYESRPLYVFHGHQASIFFERFNALAGTMLRFLANPLGIKNYSVSQVTRRKFITENRVYRFSARQRIVSIIGHTHRPLFESLSKVDSLKFAIESLLQVYPEGNREQKRAIRESIELHVEELRSLREEKRRYTLTSSIYSEDVIIPLLFNSGCGIGKRGITGLEIAEGCISLLHFFDAGRPPRYLGSEEYEAEPLQAGSGSVDSSFKVRLRQDRLADVFTRIELLS